MHDTLPLLKKSDFPAITKNNLEVLQVNLGYLCNLSCTHCHVNAGPKRKELMQRKTINQVLDFIKLHTTINTIDLTGGAPEMNPQFKYLVVGARAAKVKVIDRCNLTILVDSRFEDLIPFMAKNQVEIIASLPCYKQDNVDKQRGKGTFNDSIVALKALNKQGYGQKNTKLILNLVFNPQGATLPPAQKPLEHAYKQHLKQQFGIVFNQLFTLTNLPIQRFGSSLISKGKFDQYLHLLRSNFKSQNLEQVMCRNTISLDWQGYAYDCDFNQMLNLSLAGKHKKIHLTDLTQDSMLGKPIKTLQHCYGCTAGQGSSCGGALN